MLLAELEVRHSRSVVPTRRVALGELWLPTDPPPGFGGVLLAGIVAANIGALDDEQRDDLDVLIDALERGRRVPQPRLRHRFQTDTHGLDRSRHRLVGVGQAIGFELDDHAHALPQVLGAVYAAGLLSVRARPAVFRLIWRALRWEGDADDRLVAYLRGDEAAFRSPRERRTVAWALDVLGFDSADEPPRYDVLSRFRQLVRDAHPDHGADAGDAGRRVSDLTEAKRILLAAS